MKKLFFNHNLDLNACSAGHLLKILLIRKIAQLISRNKQEDRMRTARPGDFVLIFLIHRCFPVFLAIDRLRVRFAQRLNRS
jgi:hypothetical protein